MDNWYADRLLQRLRDIFTKVSPDVVYDVLYETAKPIAGTVVEEHRAE